MIKKLILLFTTMFLYCYSFADTVPSYPATQVKINNNSTFIMGLQSAPFDMNAHYNQSNNNQESNVYLCYTVDTNNVLYYLNKSCNPSIINDTFNTINIKDFFNNKTYDAIMSATSDNQGNIYFLIDSIFPSGYIICYNIITGDHRIISFALYYQISSFNRDTFTSDNQGNLYVKALYDSYPTIILQSKDNGNTWQDVTYNLIDFPHQFIDGIMYNNFMGALQTDLDYQDTSGYKNLLLNLPDNNTNWLLNAIQPDYDANDFADGNYSYTGYFYRSHTCGGVSACNFGYYTNWQIIRFMVTNVDTQNGLIIKSSFDNQNNMYFTMQNGIMYYFKAPM